MTKGDWVHIYSRSGSATPLRLLVVQPTPFCNIDCNYCYLADRQDKKRMSLETFRAILDRLNDAGLYGSELTILWHGGEPLTVPLAFYRDAHALCLAGIPDHCRFQFNFQTNATLITDEFCTFARETGAHVGVSIDGPQDLTDAARMFRNGRGAWSAIMDGIARLKENNVPFSAICVLRSESLDQADRMFEYFASLGADEIGFNVEEIEGANRSSALLADPAGEERYKAFIRTIHRRSRAVQPAVRFRDLARLEHTLRHGTELFSRLVNPFSIVSVAHNGDWSTFAPELLHDPRFRFGNVHHAGFETALDNAAFLEAQTDIAAGVAKCRDQCEHFLLCGGGCPSNKLAETGSTRSTETRYCRLTRKALADVLLDELEQEHGLIREC